MTKLSVVIIARNEEEDIVRCLRSVEWADERIVVDSGSTDQTVALARKHATKVLDHPFTDFATQRNWALEQTTHDWVLMVDADEVVPDELRREIVATIENPTCHGYYLPRIDYTFGKWLRYGETRKKTFAILRLARKDKGTWKNPIHEVWDIKEPTGKLAAPLLHYSHPDLEEFIEKLNRYTTTDAQTLFEQGVRTAWWSVFVYPAAKFFVNYILKLGMLDGVHGFIFAMLMSWYSFTKRAKLWLLWWNVGKR